MRKNRLRLAVVASLLLVLYLTLPLGAVVRVEGGDVSIRTAAVT